jgi:hypothetical protein
MRMQIDEVQLYQKAGSGNTVTGRERHSLDDWHDRDRDWV